MLDLSASGRYVVKQFIYRVFLWCFGDYRKRLVVGIGAIKLN